LRNEVKTSEREHQELQFQSSCEATGLRNKNYFVYFSDGTTCFNPLARQRGCATLEFFKEENGIGKFQSSCEATGLRNSLQFYSPAFQAFVSILLRGNGVAQREYHYKYSYTITRFNPLARQRGCATNEFAEKRQWTLGVSILLRGNGVAQRKMGTQPGVTEQFQSSCEATGLRNKFCSSFSRASGIGFNPLARQRGCATRVRWQ